MQYFVCFVDFMVVTDLHEFKCIFRVGVFKAEVENTPSVHVDDEFLHAFVVHEPAARVGQRLLLIAPLREVRREPV